MRLLCSLSFMGEVFCHQRGLELLWKVVCKSCDLVFFSWFPVLSGFVAPVLSGSYLRYLSAVYVVLIILFMFVMG
ncbi:hypothetical protein N665_0533s0019 [Sinapis alba]|nr:hypothetical protein N665_0533s0019 [Sinapis alba]